MIRDKKNLAEILRLWQALFLMYLASQMRSHPSELFLCCSNASIYLRGCHYSQAPISQNHFFLMKHSMCRSPSVAAIATAFATLEHPFLWLPSIGTYPKGQAVSWCKPGKHHVVSNPLGKLPTVLNAWTNLPYTHCCGNHKRENLCLFSARKRDTSILNIRASSCRTLPDVGFSHCFSRRGYASSATMIFSSINENSSSFTDPPTTFLPTRGTRDFYPEDMRRRNWLFSEWKNVSEIFGFEPYDAPLVENLSLFEKRSPSLKEQLYTFEDKSGRLLALRAEMTPSLIRLLKRKGASLSLPLKWYSIPQCW
ncbi:tRna ligase class II core domain (G, H, P, S and T) domain-containing protein, partial [Cardiosporidium cionae]